MHAASGKGCGVLVRRPGRRSLLQLGPDLFERLDTGARDFLNDSRSRPFRRVDQNFPDVFVIKDREGLMTGRKIEDSAVSALKCDAAAEDFAAFIPGDEYNILGSRDVEALAVHFRMRKFEVLRKSRRDRVCGLNGPDAFLFPDFAPFEVAGCSKHPHEDFGLVTGMKHDQTHSLLNAFLDAVHNLIFDFSVRHVPPPEKNVGFVKKLLGKAVFGVLVKPGICDIERSVFEKRLSDGGVNSLRIGFPADLVLKFMAVLIPYCDIDFPVHSGLFCYGLRIFCDVLLNPYFLIYLLEKEIQELISIQNVILVPQFVRIAMANFEDIRIWSLRFQLLRPMETLPVPYEVVLEKQTSPAYHLEGRGRVLDHAQIVCTMSGEGAFRLKDKVCKLTPGMTFMAQLGDPNTAYYYPGHATEPWIFLWISFDGFRAVEIIREMNERYGYVFRLPLDTGFVKHLEAYKSPRGTLRFVTPTEGAKIVHDALASLGDTIERPEMLSRRNELVRAAQELIAAHLDRSMDLEAIARELHVSREHLSRVFSAQTGISPGAFAAQERMRAASRLLRDRTLNCKEIAARLGFSSAGSFARAFRNHYRISPTQYLKK